MEIFSNTNDAPFPPKTKPLKATRIRIPQDNRFLSCKPTSNNICTVFPQPTDLKCAGCGVTRYCSKKCQKMDRPTHKYFCASFDSFSADKRPSLLHIRAILFPAEKDRPEWTWVLMTQDRTAIALPHLYEGLPTDGLTQRTPVMYFNSLTSRTPQHWITGLVRNHETRGEGVSSINKSLLGLGPPGQLHTYWGPFLVVANKPDLASQPDDRGVVAFMEDMEMEDVWPVVEGCLYGDKKSPCVVNLSRCPYKSLPGIKINCVGDRRRFHPENPTSDQAIYESVIVPNNFPFRERWQWPSILSFMLALPWLCRFACNSTDLWEMPANVPRHPDLVKNDELGYLHVSLKEHGPQFLGFRGPDIASAVRITLEFTPHYGSVALVHMYGDLIRPEHVRLVNMFAAEKGFGTMLVMPGLLSYKEINPSAFRKFWDEKKRENAIPGLDLRDVPPPYGWEDQPRDPDKCVKNLAHYESFFDETANNVFFWIYLWPCARVGLGCTYRFDPGC